MEFWWENIKGNLRRANTEPSFHFRTVNTEPSLDFRKANKEPSMHFRAANGILKINSFNITSKPGLYLTVLSLGII